MCMTFKLMIAFFLAMLSCFSSTAGRSYVPSEIQTEIEAGRGGKSNLYIVTSRDAVEGVIVNARMKTTPVTFQPGDTLYVTEKNLSPDRNGVLDESASIVILSLSDKKIALVPSKALTNIYDAEEFLADRQESDANTAARDEVVEMISGDNSFPFSAVTAIIVILLLCIFTGLGLHFANRMLANATDHIDIRLFRIYVFTAAVLMIALFAFQFELFYNGQKVLSDWFKGDIRHGNTFINMLLLVVKGFGMFIVVIWEFAMFFRLLGRMSILAEGRSSFAISIILWMLTIAAEIVATFFFPKHILTVAYISLALIGADCMWTVFSFRKSMSMMVLSFILCIFSAVSLTVTFANVMTVMVWIVIAFFVFYLFHFGFTPPQIIGVATNRMGHVIGHVYSDGRISFIGGGSADVSEVSNKVEVKE